MTPCLDLSISVVIYNNDLAAINRLFNSILNTGLNLRVFVIDNAPKSDIEQISKRYRFNYIPSPINIGFGAGHNIAIKKALGSAKYHLVINPDIYFEKGTLEKIYNFMEDNAEIGLVMPRVLYPDGSIQYLCRLLPTPVGLLLRKLNLPALTKLHDSKYELRFADYNRAMEAPYLSGCFMFIRNEVFEKVGVFDERFFMYLEDVDLSRRIYSCFRNVYYPGAVIYHGYARDSLKSFKLTKYLIDSAIKYFNKWGWFLDRQRTLVNSAAIRAIKNQTTDASARRRVEGEAGGKFFRRHDYSR